MTKGQVKKVEFATGPDVKNSKMSKERNRKGSAPEPSISQNYNPSERNFESKLINYNISSEESEGDFSDADTESSFSTTEESILWKEQQILDLIFLPFLEDLLTILNYSRLIHIDNNISHTIIERFKEGFYPPNLLVTSSICDLLGFVLKNIRKLITLSNEELENKGSLGKAKDFLGPFIQDDFKNVMSQEDYKSMKRDIGAVYSYYFKKAKRRRHTPKIKHSHKLTAQVRNESDEKLGGEVSGRIPPDIENRRKEKNQRAYTADEKNCSSRPIRKNMDMSNDEDYSTTVTQLESPVCLNKRTEIPRRRGVDPLDRNDLEKLSLVIDDFDFFS
ncbi:uncharacterized protein NDAI_0G03570 [Naumovozyma dairenensis CBS 421]|uniref:Uncharacterized protein n=1 Tax=Naumovozyma dairenensis (strain ATCC 10597 / BCRC 20456 / CBS 421 / NBRC 0211 / NRRL Y-12639) TaxID=1071378 RepID=G0WEC3_NAUDC|nr:hypothetical protein NDAI_0G03570 [Naumovozyma dairenensis CBS 421]CCD26134.2 hypothetical protein NDAI_0G03570 [Naumovozyma dairenensis CBS 421]